MKISLSRLDIKFLQKGSVVVSVAVVVTLLLGLVAGSLAVKQQQDIRSGAASRSWFDRFSTPTPTPIDDFGSASIEEVISTPIPTVGLYGEDRTPPVINLFEPKDGQRYTGPQTTTITLKANAQDDQEIRRVDFLVDGVGVGSNINPDRGTYFFVNWTFSNDSASPYYKSDGYHTISAVAYDVANNKASDSVQIYLQIADKTAPVVRILSPAPDSKLCGSQRIEAQIVDESNVTQCEFFFNNTYISSTQNIGDTSKDPYVYSCGLTINTASYPDGVYKLGVRATDKYDNTSSISYVENVRFDNHAPEKIRIEVPANTEKVSGTVSIRAAYQPESCQTQDRYITAMIEGVCTLYEHPIPGTTPSTANWFWDTVGKELGDKCAVGNGPQRIEVSVGGRDSSDVSDSISVNVQNGDTVPPSAPENLRVSEMDSMTAGRSEPIVQNQALLTWSPASDDNYIDHYNVERRIERRVDDETLKVLTVFSFQASTTSTSYLQGDLVCDTKYQYRVRAVDGADNVSEPSATVNYSYPCPADQAPPSVPQNLRSTGVSETQINLAWDASYDNADGTKGTGVGGYRVYRNGTNVTPSGLITTTSFGDTGLEPGISYNYQVQAVDNATPSNSSGLSASVQMRTASQTLTATGTVSGSVRNRYWSRTTYLVAVANEAGKIVAKTSTNSWGAFALAVPAGTYTVAVYSPDQVMLAERRSVAVQANQTTSVYFTVYYR